jgi:hypothetical protein
MFSTRNDFARDAANDGAIARTRTVPIPTSVTAVPNYPSKLVVYKIAASKYWQVRCWHAGRTHKCSTKTTKLSLAQRFARAVPQQKQKPWPMWRWFEQTVGATCISPWPVGGYIPISASI